MRRNHLKVVVDESGHGRTELDGVDISHILRGATIRFDVTDPPTTARLTLYVDLDIEATASVEALGIKVKPTESPPAEVPPSPTDPPPRS